MFEFLSACVLKNFRKKCLKKLHDKKTIKMVKNGVYNNTNSYVIEQEITLNSSIFRATKGKVKIH